MSEENRSHPEQRSNIGLWITLAVVGSLLIAWVFLVRPEISLKQATERPGVGQPLPMLELQPLTGTTEGISLADLHGKVVLIDFWGPWCGFCVQEFPHLVELWDKNRDNPQFAFISVSSDGSMRDNVPELRSDTEAFLRRRSATIPTYVDPEGGSRKMLMSVMGVSGFGYPTTVLLDRAGVIRAIWLGYEPGFEQQMEKLVSELLNEKQ
jgi:cytochrome c biogenesis protein CcmG, thiol:disulfide interchange protein DsbE